MPVFLGITGGTGEANVDYLRSFLTKLSNYTLPIKTEIIRMLNVVLLKKELKLC